MLSDYDCKFNYHNRLPNHRSCHIPMAYSLIFLHEPKPTLKSLSHRQMQPHTNRLFRLNIYRINNKIIIIFVYYHLLNGPNRMFLLYLNELMQKNK